MQTPDDFDKRFPGWRDKPHPEVDLMRLAAEEAIAWDSPRPSRPRDDDVYAEIRDPDDD